MDYADRDKKIDGLVKQLEENEQRIRKNPAVNLQLETRDKILNALGGYGSFEFWLISDAQIDDLKKNLELWVESLVNANKALLPLRGESKRIMGEIEKLKSSSGLH